MQPADVMTIKLPASLPPKIEFDKSHRRAPDRGLALTNNEKRIAIKNALRYIPHAHHVEMAAEFLEELTTMGRIYGYRYRPTGIIRGKSVDEYKGIPAARGLQVMIDNNLDFDIALYPYELVTYGETGQVCQNWMQYQLIKRYLEEMTEDQTLVVSSGHPVGLFPSSPLAPRVISTHGLMVGQWDDPDNFRRLTAMGVTNYGQMTAGGWMYIGPQGIVHGTYITLLNAGRKYLGIPADGDLAGIVFVSSGLGGMSGAQAKAVEIAGGIGVIAEVDASRIETRHSQGWVAKKSQNLNDICAWIKEYKENKKSFSIAYEGNIVDLLTHLNESNLIPELVSDQTSCHAVYEGGYTPAGISFSDGRYLLKYNLDRFKKLVDESLIKHYEIIKELTQKGSYFWDYGNSFMASVFFAGAKDIAKNQIDTSEGFIWPSYVEDIMGPICFDRGFGPFRWVCLSGKPEDLHFTDQLAMACINPERSAIDRDNYNWIKSAEENKLVVGTQARILYADEEGRIKIALKFNEMIRKGKIGPIILGRDHHDTSGTDSPFRETANIYDGSNVTADMSVQCFAGNVARGMALVVLSNGGGVGIGRSSNGGNAIFLDGSQNADQIIKRALSWDVMGGVARRNWASNAPAIEVSSQWNIDHQGEGQITIPYVAADDLLDDLLK